MTNPAHNTLAAAVETLKGFDVANLDSADLVPLVKRVQEICAFSAALHAEIERRAIANGELLPGATVKDATVHRKWHDQAAAEQLAQEQFGDAAFVRELKSPAQIEKLPGGDTFVSVAAFKPDAPKKVVY